MHPLLPLPLEPHPPLLVPLLEVFSLSLVPDLPFNHPLLPSLPVAAAAAGATAAIAAAH